MEEIRWRIEHPLQYNDIEYVSCAGILVVANKHPLRPDILPEQNTFYCEDCDKMFGLVPSQNHRIIYFIHSSKRLLDFAKTLYPKLKCPKCWWEYEKERK